MATQDFVQDAAKDTAFVISLGKQGADIEVHVPSFKERTQHLRERLRAVSQELKELVAIRDECDDLATQGAKRCESVSSHPAALNPYRVASLGFAGLLGYWVLVYRLTFGPDGYVRPVVHLLAQVLIGSAGMGRHGAGCVPLCRDVRSAHYIKQ
jgi:nitrate reductase NapE component